MSTKKCRKALELGRALTTHSVGRIPELVDAALTVATRLTKRNVDVDVDLDLDLDRDRDDRGGQDGHVATHWPSSSQRGDVQVGGRGRGQRRLERHRDQESRDRRNRYSAEHLPFPRRAETSFQVTRPSSMSTVAVVCVAIFGRSYLYQAWQFWTWASRTAQANC